MFLRDLCVWIFLIFCKPHILFYALPVQGLQLIKKEPLALGDLSSLFNFLKSFSNCLNLNLALLSRNLTPSSSSGQEGRESEEGTVVER